MALHTVPALRPTVPVPTPANPWPGTRDDVLTLGPVELRVTDVARATRFWTELIGLQPVGDVAQDEIEGVVRLGSGGAPLVLLRETATRPAIPGRGGLYHVAMHYPTALEFGRVIARLATAGWPASPVDHLFSKAVYLSDPDGIGVELALETPWRMRELRVDDVNGLHSFDREGRIHRPSEPLDVRPLLAEAAGRDLAAPADGAYVGHVHLSVPDLPEAVAFARDELGFTEHVNEPSIGMADLHAGGGFTHRLALNTFHGPGVPPTLPEAAGMDRFTVRYRNGEDLDRTLARLAAAHRAIETDEEGRRVVRDPADNVVVLTADATHASPMRES